MLYYESAKSTSHKGLIQLAQIRAVREGVGGTAHSFSIDHVHEDALKPGAGGGGGSGGGGAKGGGDEEPTIYSLVCQAPSDAVRDEWVTAIRNCLERTHKFKIVLLGEVRHRSTRSHFLCVFAIRGALVLRGVKHAITARSKRWRFGRILIRFADVTMCMYVLCSTTEWCGQDLHRGTVCA